jgi:hypothetical protein
VKDRFYKELEHVFDKFPKYHMKILLGNFNAILKPTVGSESLHEINNDNGVRVVHLATSPDGKTRNQIEHVLIDRRQH